MQIEGELIQELERKMNSQTSYLITGEKVKNTFLANELKTSGKLEGPKLKDSFTFSVDFDDVNA